MNREQVIKLAEELYNWSGRYGSNNELWSDTTEETKSPYMDEAEFILREFIKRHFGYRLVPELKVLDSEKIDLIGSHYHFFSNTKSLKRDYAKSIAKAQRDYDLQQIGEANNAKSL